MAILKHGRPRLYIHANMLGAILVTVGQVNETILRPRIRTGTRPNVTNTSPSCLWKCAPAAHIVRRVGRLTGGWADAWVPRLNRRGFLEQMAQGTRGSGWQSLRPAMRRVR